MGWILSLFKAFPALRDIIKMLGKALRNAKANNHVDSSRSAIDSAIDRVRVRKDEARQRQPADPEPR